MLQMYTDVVIDPQGKGYPCQGMDTSQLHARGKGTCCYSVQAINPLLVQESGQDA